MTQLPWPSIVASTTKVLDASKCSSASEASVLTTPMLLSKSVQRPATTHSLPSGFLQEDIYMYTGPRLWGHRRPAWPGQRNGPSVFSGLALPAWPTERGVFVVLGFSPCQILPPWDWGRKNRFSDGLAHNRSKVSGTWAEIDGSHTNFSRSSLPFMSKNHENG